MNLDCHGLSWAYSDGGVVLRALRTVDGGKELTAVPPPFDPYCYIESDGFDPHPFNASGARLADGAPDGYLKVEADTPSDLRSFRDAYPFETYESDVGFAQRVLIDTDVSLEPPDDVLYFDIEVDDRGGFEDASDAGRVVVSIAGVPADPSADPIYEDLASHGGEKELLEAFLGRADEYAALVGWNSEGYDFEYLENRCLEHGLDVDWRRWVRLDAMPLYDMLGVPTKTVSTNLDDTAERELGVGKTGVEAGGGEIWRLHEGDPGALREYNIRDCELVRDIDDKFSLLEILYVVCDLCNYPPGDACYQTKHGQVRFAIGQVVDGKMLEVAHRRGVPQHDSGAFDKPPGFPGGYVLDPVPGLYEDVVAPDYSGMYPNIVRAWNFGRETFVPEEVPLEEGDDGVWRAAAGEHAGRRVVRAETGAFVHPDDGPRSIPAQAADELVRMREGARVILDKGVKAIANTLYGIFASDRHRYFGPFSENITLIGQELTGKVEEIAGSGHPDIDEVIYGDSVPGYEPVVWRRDGKAHVTRIDEVPCDADKVRGSNDWTDLKRVIEKPNRKQMYRVVTGAGVVHATEDHSLILADGEERSPENVEPGDRLLHNPTHESDLGAMPGDEYEPTDDEAWLLGVFAGDGSAGSYDTTGGKKHQWKVSKNDAELLHEVGGALQAVHGVNYRVRDSYTDDSLFVTPIETIKRLAVKYRDRCYDDAGDKIVPSSVLNGGRERVLSFLAGYARADGEDEPRSSKLLTRFSTKSRPLAQGIRVLLERLGTGMGVETRHNHGNEYIRAWPRQWTRSDTAVVESVEAVDYNGDHVYDLTTADESFGAGVGDIVVHNTDSIMVSMADPDDPIEAAHRVSDDVEAAMKEWAAGRGANADYLELDVDDVYERFYIGDKKKRYFGRRIYDGEPCDNFKVRGFEARQGDWPEPVREFQEELMHAVLEDEPTRPIVEEAREALFAGRFDPELATSTSLSKPLEEYDVKLPHTRAAEALREEFDRGAADVGDKINYIKYANANEAVTWVRDGEPGRDFRPNEGWCPECGKVVRDPHPHETEAYPHFREQHYGYLWEKKFASVAESIGVDTSRGSQTGLGDYQ